MTDVLDFNEFLKRSNEFHNYKYDYSEVEYKNIKTDVRIICKDHGPFYQTPFMHFKTIGCRQCCLDDRYARKLASLIEEFNVIHENKYDYSKAKYTGKFDRLEVVCKIHGSFWVRSNHHMEYGCPSCIKDSKLKDKIDNFLKRARETHGDKYEYLTKNMELNNHDVDVVCKKHGVFNLRMYSHFRGDGCSKCYAELPKLQFTTDEIIERAKAVHGNRYDYSKSIYNGSSNTMTIICKIHGEFEQTPGVHIGLKCGCMACGGRLPITEEKFIELATERHNGKYDYSQLNYTVYKSPVNIICPVHGIFEQKPSYHLSGSGCLSCGYNVSKSETEWLDYMGVSNEPGSRNIFIKIGNKKFNVDGYDPETNTIYEYYGDFWHGNPKVYNSKEVNQRTGSTFGKLYKQTIEREKKIIKAGYKLSYIWEQDWKALKRSIQS